MSSDPQVERCLSSIRELSSALSAELRALSPEAWDRVSNCAPWRVADLVAHIIVSGEGFAASIEGGLAGTTVAEHQTTATVTSGRRSSRQTARPSAARELDAITDRVHRAVRRPG